MYYSPFREIGLSGTYIPCLCDFLNISIPTFAFVEQIKHFLVFQSNTCPK